MKEVERLPSDEAYLEAREIVRIANQAASKARAENLKYGIPKMFSRKGIIYYEFENGHITTEKPEIFKKKPSADK
jgi:hypothetical protein